MRRIIVGAELFENKKNEGLFVEYNSVLVGHVRKKKEGLFVEYKSVL